MCQEYDPETDYWADPYLREAALAELDYIDSMSENEDEPLVLWKGDVL